jgi:predicted polyphosphate/ATP-dependent NAD kinase
VFDNAEKGSMVHRLLGGLGAAGVDRALLMPAGDGLLDSLRRHLRGRTGRLARQRLPELEVLDLPLRGDARDTAAAVVEMRRQGVGALVVLGGDGTARVVAEHCGDVPISALSTGTNNAFPEMREATVVGLAVGMLAAGRLDGAACTRTHKALAVSVDGEVTASALVDVAAVSDPFIGARALWRPEAITDVVVAFADPGVVGLAGLAGQVEPVARDAPYGLHLRLTDPSHADRVVTAALGPGLVVAVGVAAVVRLQPGDEVAFDPAHASVALDGERELEVHPDQRVAVRLGATNLRTVDVDAVMREAAARGLLTEEAGE